MQKKVVSSFDVFDTCLLRRCGTGAFVVDVLSKKVFSEPVSDEDRHAFMNARLVADYSLDMSDKTIDDIYHNLSFSHPLLLPIDQIKTLELELEKTMLIPSEGVKQRITTLRDKGHHIIFISDMYLPSTFLKEVLSGFDIFREGDSIYVSCECGKTKSRGDLYDYIADKEQISFYDWYHYGDNRLSDFEIPKRKGIKATLIAHKNLPYQILWHNGDVDMKNRTGVLMAGLSRSVYYSMPNNEHKSFVTDIIAPLYVSFVCRVLNDATRRGIRTLFFCARDASSLYKIAQRLTPYYSNIEVQYLYISQQSLYHGDESNRMGYFEQVGLAGKDTKVAIVDIRTTGKTLKKLNDDLTQKGYNPIFGYFFEMFCNGKVMDDMPEYYCEINHVYGRIHGGALYNGLMRHWCMFEMFFSLHNEKRTIDYAYEDGLYSPVFADKPDGVECKMNDIESVARIHDDVLAQYVEGFVSLELHRHADELFVNVALPTLIVFFTNPNYSYLKTLTGFYVRDEHTLKLRPYVEKHNLLYFLFVKKDYMWRKASLNYSLPWLTNRLAR